MSRVTAALPLAATLLIAAAVSASTSESDTAWTLEDCLRRARDVNPTILSAEADQDRTDGIIRSTRAEALPHFSFGASYQWLDEDSLESFGDSQDDSTVFGDEEQYQYGFRASQLLYRGGQVQAAVRAARLGRDGATAQLDRAIADIWLSVRLAYYEILLNQSRLQVQEQNVELLEEELTIANSRFRAGRVPRLDVLRAEVALANGQPQLINARNQLRLARERLADLLMLDPSEGGNGLPEASDELEPPRAPLELDVYLETAAESRPELDVLRLLQQIRGEALTAARSGRLPTVSADADYGWRNSQLGTGEELEGWTAMLMADLPIFDGQRTRGRVEEARAELDQAGLQLAETRRAIELEVRAAHGDLLESIEFYASQRKNGERAEEALRLARAAYDAGTGTQLDVLDARVALTLARSLEVEALFSCNSARARLEHAAGRTSSWLPDATTPDADPEATATVRGD